ncbi:GAF and ANTAR domain-containing protein (plasmid) [Rhodococcus antarcticus]|jgi:GAF domain-containing protein|uniref:GAF and ANTAR domain-containing protein n=1 Tax=Rhodococcus antarcticus TaxID=2987751 RepID=A0ABY6P5W9_9NOCA|nr:GAF and ANTAR domain-containing protein [Rhodococcus antarcticus]UZJ27052.1 GAF and ANTAR domain-containing protein [Rhodococcus antarcticus]
MDPSPLVHPSSAAPAPVQSGTIHDAVSKNPHEVADIVANLAWTPHDEDELVEYLDRCAGLATRTIGGADHAGITGHTDTGAPVTIAHTDKRTLVIDQSQYAAGDGPCLHAMRSGDLVRVDVATSRARWPQFTADSEHAGVRSFLAAPLGTGSTALGALNLYSDSPDGFGPDDDPLLLLLVEHATRAITDYRLLTAAATHTRQLQEAMATRAPIEQAKGILMALHHCDSDTAFTMLRTESQNTNTKLNTVARAFITAHTGQA